MPIEHLARLAGTSRSKLLCIGVAVIVALACHGDNDRDAPVPELSTTIEGHQSDTLTPGVAGGSELPGDGHHKASGAGGAVETEDAPVPATPSVRRIGGAH